MSTSSDHEAGAPYRGRLLSEQVPLDRQLLMQLRADEVTEFIDARDRQIEELRSLLPTPDGQLLEEQTQWVHYPWRRTVVGVLGEQGFRRVRFDRNRNKITTDEQNRLRRLKIGVVGVSVGHSIAHTLALEGACGELRLADFDQVDLSNLNRIPGTVLDLGINKAVLAARRIAELDPYLEVRVFEEGLTDANHQDFFAGLDLVIEECDSLDIKVMVREKARAQRIPVFMETSDRGLLDVERFDLDADRPLFHGLLGAVRRDDLRGLTVRDKVPHVMRIVDAGQLSARAGASLVEIDRTVSAMTQLGGDVQLGGATVVAAVRKLALGGDLKSGRVRVDISERLDSIAEPDAPATPLDIVDPVDEVPSDTMGAVLNAVQRAPSGGNAQPWNAAATLDQVSIDLAPERTSAMDVEFRGSAVAIGAAAFNARVAASANQLVGETRYVEGGASVFCAEMRFARGTDRGLAAMYSAMLDRGTNRNLGTARPLDAEVIERLCAAAEMEGGFARLALSREAISDAANVIANSDRIRYLTPLLHGEMFSELRRAGLDDLSTGIDLRTLELDETDLVKLDVVGRPDIVSYLHKWGGGAALGDDTRDRILSSSALLAVTFEGKTLADFARGGSAVERVWIEAGAMGLAVQPMSPVFLYALEPKDFDALSTHYAVQLADYQREFRSTMRIERPEQIALVLRISHATPATIRSRRRAAATTV